MHGVRASASSTSPSSARLSCLFQSFSSRRQLPVPIPVVCFGGTLLTTSLAQVPSTLPRTTRLLHPVLLSEDKAELDGLPRPSQAAPGELGTREVESARIQDEPRRGQALILLLPRLEIEEQESEKVFNLPFTPIGAAPFHRGIATLSQENLVGAGEGACGCLWRRKMVLTRSSFRVGNDAQSWRRARAEARPPLPRCR